MSNFLEFQVYKSHCPLCGQELTTYFHSISDGEVHQCELDGEDLVIHDKFKTYALGAGATFLLEYRLDTSTGAFSIERVATRSSAHRLHDQWSLSAVSEINRHLGRSCCLARRCDTCLRYRYSTGILDFDRKSAAVSSIEVVTDCIFLSKPRDNDVMAYCLIRYFEDDQIELDYGPIATHLLKKTNLVQMPLEKRLTFPWMDLDFSNPSALIKKMDTLIFFS